MNIKNKRSREPKTRPPAEESSYRRLFESSQDGILILDAQTGIILDANPITQTLLGIKPEILMGKKLWEIPQFKRISRDEKSFQDIRRKGYARFDYLPLESEGGQALHVEVIFNVYNAAGRESLQCNIRDVSDLKNAEDRIKHLNLALQAVHHVNQLMIREKDPGALIRKTCRMLTETRGYTGAWILLFDSDHILTASAAHGYGGRFLKMIRQFMDGNRCQCGEKALEHKGIVSTSKTKDSCGGCPLHELTPYETAFTIRLEHKSRIFGLLSVSLPGHLAENAQERDLFNDLANDLALALYSIDLAEKHQRAEETLRESEQRNKILLSNLQGMVYRCTIEPDRTMHFVSDGCLALTGYQPSDLVDNRKISYQSLIHPEDREAVRQYLQEAITKNKPYEIDYRIITRDEKEIWVLEWGVLVSDPRKEPVFLEGFIADITLRKLAGKKLREREGLLNAMGQIAKIGGWEMDIQTGKATWTQGTYDIAEIEPGDPIPGLNEHVEYYLPEFQPLVVKAMQDLIDKAERMDIEAQIRTAKGRIIWCRALGNCIRKNGECVKVYGTIQDITERKQAEMRIEKDLHEKNVMFKEIHHRVKNNMQIIASIVRLQSRNTDDEKFLGASRILQSRIKAMALIHEKLYESPDLAKIDFSTYIEHLSVHLSSIYNSSAANVQLRFQLEPIFLDVYHAIPCGLLMNELISNALLHAFPKDRKGRVVIRVNKDGAGQRILAVEDDGIGLPDRIDPGKPETLGLQLVNDLVLQISAEIEWNRKSGTRVTITF